MSPDENATSPLRTRWEDLWPMIRVMIAAGFAFSCFGLLLFIWVQFGGPVPLAAQSYQFTADFPEALTLGKEADVRVAGVNVGKVKQLGLPPDGNATRATIEIDEEYAPISSDARAILRQKTLLGETYIELTTGSRSPPQGGEETAAASATDVSEIIGGPEPIPEDGHLEDTQVEEQTQIDEIFNALDEETRNAFRVWMREAGIAGQGRGLDLSDSFGNLGPFAQDAANVLETLRRQDEALKELVASTGQTFAALTKRDKELRGAVRGSHRTFGALAAEDEALAESFQILPEFERESRRLFRRLETFSQDAAPFARRLKPVARNLTPTLRDVRRLSPHLVRTFRRLGDLVTASRRGLPALRGTVRELNPVMSGLDPFLANFVPIVRYVRFYRANVADFLTAPPEGLSGTMDFHPDQPAPRHTLRQISYISPESLSVYPVRLAQNRGHGYPAPFNFNSAPILSQGGRFNSFDCNNTQAVGGLGGGQVTSNPPSFPQPTAGVFPLSIGVAPPLNPFGAMAACLLPANFPATFGGGRAPQVFADP